MQHRSPRRLSQAGGNRVGSCMNTVCYKYSFLLAVGFTAVLATTHIVTSYRKHTSLTPLHTLLKASKRATPEDSMDSILQRPKIVLFGDSLTERGFDTSGWGTIVQSNYSRRVSVVQINQRCERY